jgi:hypothetical protein
MVSHRFALHAAVLGAALILPGASVTLAAPGGGAASAAGWHLSELPGGTLVSDLTAAGGGVAWAVGETQGSAVLVQRWTAGIWHSVPVPRAMVTSGAARIGASSATNAWIFTSVLPAAAEPYSVAWHWNGHAWSRFRLADNAIIAASEVFGEHDAWAFGSRGGTPYVLHYDGSRWRRVPAPLSPISVSARSASNFWAVGFAPAHAGRSAALATAHWSGRSWQLRRLPRALVARGGRALSLQIVALSRSTIWVGIGLAYPDGKRSAIALRLSGGVWSRVQIPRQPVADPDISMTPDGRGGLWLSLDTRHQFGAVIYDYRNGSWSAPTVLARPGQTAAVWSLAGGSRSGTTWAGGSLWPKAGHPNPAAVLYTYTW